jgi:hypothetical protein
MIEVESYVPTDPFFGQPFIDVDEERDTPVPHRHIHGGFQGTDTRFRFYFPPADAGYSGRMFNPLSGANGGTEDFFGSDAGEAIGGLSMSVRLGGYMIESNQGHIGDELDPKGGDDPTLYGHRASAEVARFSKHVAAQIYGEPPHHSYVFGGSGGGRRSPLCLENAPDAYDGAVPFMGGGEVAEHGNNRFCKGSLAISFAPMFNAQRILRDKLDDIVDATAPGGSGNPFVGLDTHQREELAALYRLGYPRGDEFMIGQLMGQTWWWSSMADLFYEQEPDYFDSFWTKPGYIGHDMPQLVADDRIDVTLTVDRVVTVAELTEDPKFSAPEYRHILTMVPFFTYPPDFPIAIEVQGIGSGYRMGTGVRVLNGRASGRQLYVTQYGGDLLFCDGRGENSNLRFTDVRPGDDVHIDNRLFLAYCYYHRHHIFTDMPEYDFLSLDGNPIYPQHPLADMSPFGGQQYSAQFKGKLIWVQHTHDNSLWPAQAMVYANGVLRAQGEQGANERFRLRWTEHAEHVPPVFLPSAPGRAANTWLIDYAPVIEQTLKDVVDWVEKGIEPAATNFDYRDGKVTLPRTAAERAGIQPVVSVLANGELRAEVRAGEPVTLEAHTEVPPEAGSVVSVEWDFDGSGTFPFSHDEVDGTARELTVSTNHTFDRPGTYFVTARVCSHRDGDINATSRRIPNVAQARVIVT